VLLHENRMGVAPVAREKDDSLAVAVPRLLSRGIHLGDKALLAAQHGALSAQAMRAFQQAERYPEEPGPLLIKGPKDIPTVRKLAVAKLETERL